MTVVAWEWGGGQKGEGDEDKGAAGNLGWRKRSSPWLWWWAHGYVHMSKLIYLYNELPLFKLHNNTSIMLFLKRTWEWPNEDLNPCVSDVKPPRSLWVIKRPPFLAGDSLHGTRKPSCPLHGRLRLFRSCLPHGLSHTILLPAFRICQWLLSPLGDLPVCPLPYGPSNTLFVSPAPESDWLGFAFSLCHLHQLSDLGWFLYLFELQSPRLNNNSSYLEIALRIKWETVHGKQLAQGLVCNKALNKC